MFINHDEQVRRAEAFRQARHSTEMEGGRTSDDARADQDEFAAGVITEDELHRRIKARHGLL
ncbi:MAG: antitoxin VbhA family protein [Ornithinimicrobium sp.]